MGEVRIWVFPGSSRLSPSVMFKNGDHSSGASLTNQSRDGPASEGAGEYYMVEDRREDSSRSENHLKPAQLSSRGG